MNKNELITVVAETTGFTKKDVGTVVDSVFNVISRVLSGGENVKISNFGQFVVRERKERKGRNPQSGEEIMIPASKGIGFKPAQGLKDSVNG